MYRAPKGSNRQMSSLPRTCLRDEGFGVPSLNIQLAGTLYSPDSRTIAGVDNFPLPQQLTLFSMSALFEC